MIKRCLFIFVLCLLLIPLSSAYTEIYSQSYAESNTGYYRSSNIRVNNCQNWTHEHPTWIHYVGPYGYDTAGSPSSGEESGYLDHNNGTGPAGTWNMEWSVSGPAPGWDTLTMDIYITWFSNWESPDYVECTIISELEPWSEFNGGGNTTATAWSGELATALSNFDSTKKLVGEITVYSGDEAPPAENRLLNVHVKNLAGVSLSSHPVWVYTNDGMSYNNGTTNSGGWYNTSLDVGSNASSHVYIPEHDIYDMLDYDFEFTTSPTNLDLAVSQLSPSGDYRDVNYYIINEGGTPINNAYIQHIVSPAYMRGEYTNINGIVNLTNVPVVNNLSDYVIFKSGYHTNYGFIVYDEEIENSIITMYASSNSTATSTPTPTPTPQPQIGITLVAVPNSVNPGQQTVLTTICSNATACTGAGGLKLAVYREFVPSTPQTPWLSQVIGVYKYNTTSSGWDFRQNDTYGAWQGGSYNPLTITAHPYISGTYNYYVSLVNNQDQSLGTANTGVLVSGAVAGSLNMHMGAMSGTTGSALQNFNMNLTTVATGTVEDFGLVPYEKVKALPRGITYTIKCSKSGYLDGSRTFTVSTDPNVQDGSWGTYECCPMFPTGSISAGNTTVTVKAFDSVNFIPIPGVQISVGANPIYSSSPQFTGNQGEGVFFIIGQNTDYTITASKAGYCGVTETGNTGVLDTDLVDLYLKPGSCGGVTPTITTIPTVTTPSIYPTTFIPGGPNQTSFWDPWVNVYRMMGANDSEIPNLIAGLIIILCMAAGAGMAGVLGAEIGMGFGAIFCVSIGLIPIWVVLAIIVMGFLFYGLKIGR